MIVGKRLDESARQTRGLTGDGIAFAPLFTGRLALFVPNGRGVCYGSV